MCTQRIVGCGLSVGANVTVALIRGRGVDMHDPDKKELKRAKKEVAAEFKKRVKKQKGLEKLAKQARKQNKRNKRARDM